MKLLLLAALAAAAPAAAWDLGQILNPAAVLVFETEATGKPDVDNRLAERAVEVLRRRMDAFQISGKVERLDSGRIELTMSWSGGDAEGRLAPLLKPGRLEFRAVEEVRKKPGAGQIVVDEIRLDAGSGEVRRVPLIVDKTPLMTGAAIKSAHYAMDGNGRPAVLIEFDESGAAKFAAATRESIGRRMAMILDGRVLSAPVIRDEIGGGQAQIMGDFTERDARDFAHLLSSGELPPYLKLVKKTIGGKDVALAVPAAPAAAPAAKAPAAPAEAPAPVSDVDAPPPALARGRVDGVAVVIGIERTRQGLPRADYAAKDARVFAEYLTKTLGYREENVALLIDERAAKSDLEKYLEDWLPRKAGPGATVVVFYSGHGAPDPTRGSAYLVPYDGDPAYLGKTGYPLARLYETLGRLKGRRSLVLLDACFSGAGRRSALAKGARPLVSRIAPPPAPADLAVLSAAASDQIGGAYDEKGHGLFTYFLLRAVRDAAAQGRAPTAEELLDAVSGKVEAEARRLTGNEQTPQLQAAGDARRNSL